jgi:hypothetical protein
MKASDLIEFLKLAIEQHGDLDVKVAGNYSGEDDAPDCDSVMDVLHWRGEYLLWPFSSELQLRFAPLESIRLNCEVTETELFEEYKK